jgi:hypothetical protein
MSATRELSTSESRILGIIREYEAAIDEGALIYSIITSQSGMDGIDRATGLALFTIVDAKPVASAAFNSQAYKVTFTLDQFENYLHFVLSQAGMAYLLNGKLCFTDGYVIEV